MSEFKFKQSSLLQLFYEASQEGIINQTEKLRLKEMLMTQDVKMMNFLKEYNPDEEDKSVNFKSLKTFIEISLNPAFQMSSPEDNALIRMKKKRELQQAQNNNKTEIDPEDFEDDDETADTGFKNNVQLCEEGLSPKISFGKRPNYEDDD